MSKTVKIILWGSVGLIALLVVLKVAGAFGKEKGIKVLVEKVQRRTITETVNASGKVYPEVEVVIKPDVSGIITELDLHEGDSVKKGQVIARIYADIYSLERDQAASGVAQSEASLANSQASLDALKAQMDLAEQTYNRQKKLFYDSVISRSEFNDAEASYKSAIANYNAAKQGIRGGQASIQSAQSNLAKANKSLSKTAVLAPMDGIVSLLSVKQGESVVGNNMMSGTEMLRIADMSKIEVRVDVGENDITKVHLGDSALVDIDAYDDRKFKGIVTQISSSNNGAATQSVTGNTSSDVTNYKVYIRLLPESYMDIIGKGKMPFRPGMSASADIQTKTHINVLSVPISAVTTRDKGDTMDIKTKTSEPGSAIGTSSEDDLEVVAFVLQADNTVKKVKVKPDIQDINHMEITEGLKEGDMVIYYPYDVVNKDLKEKDKVNVVEKKDLLFDKK